VLPWGWVIDARGVPRARDVEPLADARLARLVARATNSLAANLCERRERAALTQEAVAEHAGLSTIYLQALERGDAANPSLRVVVALAHTLRCEVSDLLVARPPPKPRRPGRPRSRSVA
jgi:DNA-binding XRE family transcriptional regulator